MHKARSNTKLIVFTFIFSFYLSHAQDRFIDSLKKLIHTSKEDTTKAIALNALSIKLLQKSQYDTALIFIEQATKLSEQFLISPNASIAHCGKKTLAKASSNAGIAYSYLGNYQRSHENYFKALKLREELKNDLGVAGILGNIGLVYYYMKDFDKALVYDKRSLSLYQKINDKTGIANMLNSIGTVYNSKEDYTNALTNYRKTYDIAAELVDKRLMAYSLGNISIVYRHFMDLPNAIKYSELCIKISDQSGDQQLIGNSRIGLGETYLLLKDYAKAEKYALEGLQVVTQASILSDISEAYNILSRVNSALGKHEQALNYYTKYVALRDTLLNEENTRNAVRTEMNFEFEKKEAVVKLEQQKKEAVALTERKKQKIILWSVCGILLIVVAFAFYAYRNFLQKQKVNEAILRQKEVIEEKQKEILDSIYYAKRIQKALLPSERYIDKNITRLNT